ncbi:MAG TPA: hypothetical protein VMK05_17335 [Burkholderiales bacterium]|nr:hypothetical protein [Burkholderiales bacterium]
MPDTADPGLRPASAVMSVRHAGAAVANALSFARSALREIVRGRWKIEKPRFDLDAEGRGEVLYRFSDGHWTFHFFLVSLKLDEAQKMDRNWAQAWDAMGVLCEGEWTPEREALLRAEVPKQRAGYADYDTLVYARGNRSARLFDHVVDALAAGRQPDLGRIAQVGYILRTTAFIGNGQLGTRPYAGFAPDHPLRRPYHAQMCSAFLLREYVFDLVDHIARSRNPRAARLDPAYRRYLGLGNAAATGLVAFIVNHPHLMQRWMLAHETARARALRRGIGPDGAAGFGRLLDRAIRHYRESESERRDLFATASCVAAELERFRAGFTPLQPAGASGSQLADRAARELGPEAQEVLDALLLELHPDLVAAAVDDFDADERMQTQPAMTVAALRDLLRTHYGWALDGERGGWAPDGGTTAQKYFWYRSSQAPRDVRRGIRGLAPELESENGMDTVLQARRLADTLAQSDATATTAELLCAHPELRHIVARVQTLAGLDYAELRANWLGPEFSPFEPVRFVLALFGMEKFEAALPKSVRGAFLQGAPIAGDVEQGRDGDWPFPLIPAAGSLAVTLDPLPAPGQGALRERIAPPVRTTLRIAPNDLARTLQNALQAHGATLGVAEEAAAMLAFAQACGEAAVPSLLRQCRDGLAAGSARVERLRRAAGGCVLDAHGASALLAAPAALDLACALGGVVVVVGARHAAMLGQLALRCAERGLLGCAAWRPAAGALALALAGAGEAGPWFAFAPALDAARAPDAAAAVLGDGSVVDGLAALGGQFGVACAQGDGTRAFARLGTLAGAGGWTQVWSAAELAQRRTGWQRNGLPIAAAELAALERAAAALLVPAEEAPRLRPGEDSDPLKVF